MTADAPDAAGYDARLDKLSDQRRALLARLQASRAAGAAPAPAPARAPTPRPRPAPPPVRRRAPSPAPGRPTGAPPPSDHEAAAPPAGFEDRLRRLPPARQALLRALRERSPAGTPAATGPPSADPSPLVPLQPGGDRPPLVCAHAISGSVFAYLPLARLLGPDQPLVGLEAPGFDGASPPIDSMEALAATYHRSLADAYGSRPVALLGWSMGGVLAYEVARQCWALTGRAVPLVMVDAPLPPFPGAPDDGEAFAHFVRDLAAQQGRDGAPLDPVIGQADDAPFDDRIGRLREAGLVPADLGTEVARARYELMQAHVRALFGYARPGPLPGPITLVVAEQSVRTFDGWSDIAGPEATVDTHVLPGDHYSLWDAAHLPRLASVITDALARL